MDAVVSWLFKLKVPPQSSPLSSSTSPSLTKGWVVCGEPITLAFYQCYHSSEGIWDGGGGLSEQSLSYPRDSENETQGSDQCIEVYYRYCGSTWGGGGAGKEWRGFDFFPILMSSPLMYP